MRRFAANALLLAACGRFEFEPRAAVDGAIVDAASIDSEIDAPIDAQIDAPIDIVDITAAAVFSSGSELRRTPLVSAMSGIFTFATWMKTTDHGDDILDAGISADHQALIGHRPTNGVPELMLQEGGTGVSAIAEEPPLGDWPHLGTWTHLVIACDVTQADPAQRVRIWVDGAPQTVETATTAIPMGAHSYFGQAGVVHTFGNKFQGGFDWTGSLAETYLIYNHALDASAFIALTPDGPRSIVYTGPTEAESLHFTFADAAKLGANAFPGHPDWTASSVTSSSTDLPY